MPFKLKFLTNFKNQLLIILLATVLVYLNSLGNKIVWDDHLFLENWGQIRSFASIGEIFKGSAPQAQDKIYRPLRGVFYALDYQLWGQNPVGYHLQALFVHLAVTLLVFLIARIIIGKTIVAFLVALIFGIHPVHTETIDYIAASLETFGSLFFFASFWLYLASDKVRDETWAAVSKIGSVMLAILAFFTYEMTLTLPVLLVLFDLCLRQEYLKRAKIPKFSIFNFQFSILVAPYFAAAGIYLFVRLFVLHIGARTDYLASSFYLTMLVMLKVFVRYILLLLLPLRQTAIHNLVGDFPASMIPYDRLDPILNQTIFDLDVIFAIIFLVAIILVFFRLFKTLPLVSFGIGWFAISLAPVSYIIPFGGAMAEKYLYIASFGLIVCLIFIFSILYQKASRYLKQAMIYALVLMLGFYMIATIARNTVWKNDISLFSDVVKKSPGNLLAHYTLGIWYANSKDSENAASHYRIAIDKAPEFWEARYNLANIYLKSAKLKAAEIEYRNVLKINPNNGAAKNILNNFAYIDEKKAEPQVTDQLFVKFTKFAGMTFFFPIYFRIEEGQDGIKLADANSKLKVEISKVKEFYEKSSGDFLKKQTKSYGTLLNQGPAQIPNVSEAYVKVWNSPSVIASETKQSNEKIATSVAELGTRNDNVGGTLVKLQFFLFSGNKVMEVLVYPADSPSIDTFNLILGSIKID